MSLFMILSVCECSSLCFCESVFVECLLRSVYLGVNGYVCLCLYDHLCVSVYLWLCVLCVCLCCVFVWMCVVWVDVS